MAEMSDFGVVAEAQQPSVVAVETAKGKMTTAIDARSDTDSTTTEPTMEEMKTLRRVSGPINWQMMTVTFVEFCERFSYYGTTAVFVNFIQQPRPFGSRTGNIQENAACFAASTESACLQPGGLGLDQQAATGMTVSVGTRPYHTQID
jgi:proton-dependent oligopeptide transporter, POT family